jgi:hypothetical protein
MKTKLKTDGRKSRAEAVGKSNIARLAKEPGRYPVADAKGLFLKVKEPGRALWTYRYRFDGRETETSLGAYPKIGFAEALGLHAQKLALVRNAVDPLAAKRSGPAAVELTVTAVRRSARSPPHTSKARRPRGRARFTCGSGGAQSKSTARRSRECPSTRSTPRRCWRR